jgi:hypothetical protein
MVAHPFFCLKIGHFKATVRTVAHPSMKKQVPHADFAKTLRLLRRLWCIAQSPLACPAEAAAIYQGRTNNGANCQHSPSCFLRELPQVGDPFFTALAVPTIVVRPWHNAAGTVAES